MPSEPNGGESWLARLIQRRTGIENYEAVLSDLHEMHATEFGLMIGITLALMQVAPELGAFAAAVTGGASVADLRREGLPRFVKRNRSYAVVAGLLGYLGTHLVVPVVI